MIECSLTVTAILAAALLFTRSPLASQQKTPDVRADVQNFIRSFITATNNADAATLVEMYARIPEVASLSEGGITRGWDAIRSEADSLLGLQGRYHIDLGSVDVVPLGPTHALAFAGASFTFNTPQGTVQVHGALTFVLRKMTGGWKIIHDHSSFQAPTGG